MHLITHGLFMKILLGYILGQVLRQMMFGFGMKNGVGYGLAPRTGAALTGKAFCIVL